MIVHMSEQLILALPQKRREFNHKIASNLLVSWVGRNLTIYNCYRHLHFLRRAAIVVSEIILTKAEQID